MPTTATMPTMKKRIKNVEQEDGGNGGILYVIPLVLILLLFIFPITLSAQFQQGQLQYSQQFRLGETIIRVAEVGQLADTVHVWGDVNVAGVYVVPRGSTLAQVISYSRGPSRYFTGESTLDWSKLRIDVTVNSTDSAFTQSFRYNEALPVYMRNYVIRNNDVITLELKRKPSVLDWVRVIAPVVSTVATSILIIQNLR